MFTRELFPQPDSPKTTKLCLGPQCSITRIHTFSADSSYFFSYILSFPFELVMQACPSNDIPIFLIVFSLSRHHSSMSFLPSNPVTTNTTGTPPTHKFFWK